MSFKEEKAFIKLIVEVFSEKVYRNQMDIC